MSLMCEGSDLRKGDLIWSKYWEISSSGQPIGYPSHCFRLLAIYYSTATFLGGRSKFSLELVVST